jgi:hypothetical protein
MAGARVRPRDAEEFERDDDHQKWIFATVATDVAPAAVDGSRDRNAGDRGQRAR